MSGYTTARGRVADTPTHSIQRALAMAARKATAMLEFEGNWRFESPGPVERKVESAFRQLIDRVCGQGRRKEILEHFKSHFAAAAGVPHHRSSDESWASTDLDSVMSEASENAPLFIEAFYKACDELERANLHMKMPGVGRINRILSEAGTGFQIDPPRLIATRAHVPIAVPDEGPSLDMQAKAAIKAALDASERAFSEGNGRQAVQEVLWLLETFSTAFRSETILEGNIHGRYFNKIIGELRRHGGGHQNQILKWMMQLHGFLSSPTGGGVRHGIDLNEGLEFGITEARLYCNLIRSYLTFLIAEHERLQR